MVDQSFRILKMTDREISFQTTGDQVMFILGVGDTIIIIIIIIIGYIVWTTFLD